MRNIKITLRYDGEKYHGWQIQKNGITVQEVVEGAIQKLFGIRPHVIGCSRTDSGVHAKKYAASFKLDTTIPCDRLPYALNRFLPRDVVCIGAEDVSEDFDAQKSAVGKTYTYCILNTQYQDPFFNSRAWHYRYELDIDKMRKAAQHFVGTHDFIGFAAAGFTVNTTVRTIYSVDILKNGDMIEIKISGNGFLYNMVRIIAGTLIFVGNGKIKPEDIPDIISSKDRTRAGITAPPDGLYLTEVFYK